MAKKAIEMSVKNKTQPQESRGLNLNVDTALFCLANESSFQPIFSKALIFLVLFDQAKSTYKCFNVNYLTNDRSKLLFS